MLKIDHITIERFVKPADGDGCMVWARAWEKDSDIESAENMFSRKKDAYEWAKKTYPGVKIKYSTGYSKKPNYLNSQGEK